MEERAKNAGIEASTLGREEREKKKGEKVPYILYVYERRPRTIDESQSVRTPDRGNERAEENKKV